MIRRVTIAVAVLLLLGVGLGWAIDGPLTPLFSVRGRTDENGYLLISSGTAGVTEGPLTPLANLRGRTDENGYLRVAISGGSIPIVGGADTQICFNDAGSLSCGDANLTWSKTTDSLALIMGSALSTAVPKPLTITRTLAPTVAGAGSDYFYSQLVNTFLNPAEDLPQGFTPLFYGGAFDVTSAGANDIASVIPLESIYYNENTGATFDVHAAESTAWNAGIGTMSNVYSHYASINNISTGTITTAYGEASYVTNSGGGTITFASDFYGGPLLGVATNGYFLWYDGGGGNCDNGGVYRVNDRGISAYYNPCFATYSPGSVNFERIIGRWGDSGVFGTDNRAYLGVEVGGTGTNRNLELLGATFYASAAIEAADFVLNIASDQADDAADTWIQRIAAATNALTLENNSNVNATFSTAGALTMRAGVTATTFNGNTLTTGTYTLTGVAAKTLTFNNTLTLAGTDSTTMTFPATSANVAGAVTASAKVARGSSAFDASNPTTIATGLATVVSCTATLIRSTAISSGTAFVTHNTASGANVDWYAWLQTGAASTGTETFEWVCVGT